MLRKKRFWLGLALSAVFLFFVFRQVEWSELGAALAGARYGWLLPALVVYLGGYLVRAVRWHYLLSAIKPVPWTRLLPPLLLGFTANNVLPARAGEVAAAYLVGRREGISKSAAFATVVMQRTFDGVVMVLFAMLVFYWFQPPEWSADRDFLRLVDTVITITATLFAAVLAVLFALITFRERAAGLLSRLARLLPARLSAPAEHILHSFLAGLAVLRRRRDSILAFAATVLAWSCESAAYYFVLRAFGLTLPPYAAVMLMAVVNLGIMIPSSPGYVGPFEFFGVGTLLLFNVDKHVSLPAVLVIHAIVWLPITLWGFYYLWTLKLSLGEIENQARSGPPAAPGKEGA